MEIVKYLEGFSKGYHPRLLYCLVNRKISHRLFAKGQGNDVLNPGPGTVVDTALIELQGDNIFDFFMIPHNATVATA